MPGRRQLLFVEHLNICLGATIQNESDHVNPAEPSSIMKGSTGPWGFLKFATGTWGHLCLRTQVKYHRDRGKERGEDTISPRGHGRLGQGGSASPGCICTTNVIKRWSLPVSF